MTYTVYVDDNYDYMNESNRYTLGDLKLIRPQLRLQKSWWTNSCWSTTHPE